jgi:hypothetical protein
MATYTVTRSKHATLTAATVDTVTVTPAGYNATTAIGTHWTQVTVYNRDATNVIYLSIDGSTPTVAGDNTFVVAAAQSVTLPFGAGALNLISSGTPAYSVVCQ